MTAVDHHRTRLAPTPRPRRRSPPSRSGRTAVDPPVVLAPMAGVTNAAFRGLCRAYGDGLFVSEMITARALIEGHERTLAMARFTEDERPRSIQLYGTDPATLTEAVRRLLDDRRRRAHRHELRLPREEGDPARRRIRPALQAHAAAPHHRLGRGAPPATCP